MSVEEPSPEKVAYELVEAYDRDDSRAILLLTSKFNEELHILFESGAVDRLVGLMQIVTPAATKWTVHRLRGSSVDADVAGTLGQLTDWKTLEMLARNQFEPTRVVLARSIAKDEVPLHISVEGSEREKEAQIYHLSNSGKEWIGETPQYVILSPGLNQLVFGFLREDLGVDLTLDGDRVRVDNLHYNIDPSKLKEPLPSNFASETIARQAVWRIERARFEFISALRQHYPAHSLLQPKENGLPSLVMPSPPYPTGGGRGAGFNWGGNGLPKDPNQIQPHGRLNLD